MCDITEYRSQAGARESSTKSSQRLANHRENMSELCDRESSTKHSQRLITVAKRQWTSRIRNQSTPHSNRSAFNYNPNIDYAKQRAVTIGAMSKSSNEPNGMCCAAGKAILPDIEEPQEPVKSLLTSDPGFPLGEKNEWENLALYLNLNEILQNWERTKFNDNKRNFK